MFDTILVAIDQSDAARGALDLAIRVARVDNDKLLLVSVFDVGKIVAIAGYETPYPVDTVEMLKKSTEETLSDAKSACAKQGLNVETVLAEGDTIDEILRVASQDGVGLICIGTHGRGGLSRLFVGSVCEGVVRQANVPVLTIRPTERKAAGTQARATAQEAN